MELKRDTLAAFFQRGESLREHALIHYMFKLYQAAPSSLSRKLEIARER